jgi:hypothetical protein
LQTWNCWKGPLDNNKNRFYCVNKRQTGGFLMAEAAIKLDGYGYGTPVELRLIPKPFYTYRVYKTWPEDFRVELIDGLIQMIAPPTKKHQWVVGELFGQLRDRVCEPYMSPVGVRLFWEENESDSAVLLPDIVIICTPEQIADEFERKFRPTCLLCFGF